MNHSKPRHVKNVYGFWKKLRRKLEDKIIFKKIENRIISDIKNLFEQEGVEDYYKPVSVGNLHSNDYIKHESNDDRNKTLSIIECLDETKP